MPDETHNFLINYETTATRAAAEMYEVTRAFQEQVQWSQTATAALGQWSTTATQAIGATTGLRDASQALDTTSETLSIKMRTAIGDIAAYRQAFQQLAAGVQTATMSIEEYIARTGQMPPAERIQDPEAILARAARRLPPSVAPAQRISPYAYSGMFDPYMQEQEIGLAGVAMYGRRGTAGAMGREGLTPVQVEQLQQYQMAYGNLPHAIRETTKAQDDFGESVQRSGNWLAGYIERYLIRYFFVWQAMVAIKTGISDWTRAHEDLDRTLFRLQTTMGLTTTEAERYMATMRQMGGGLGISGIQMAAGAGQLGPTGAGMAGQFGAMTGIGAGPGMQFFAEIQRQYDLSTRQIEELIPRMFAAFARSGQDIQTFMKDWEAMLAQFDAGSAAIGEWTRGLEIYETTGMRASERVSAAWSDFLSVLGNTQPIIDAKNAIANMFTEAAKGLEWTGLPRAERERLISEYQRETGVPGYTKLGMLLPDIYPQVTPEFSKWLEGRGAPTGGPITTDRNEERRLQQLMQGGGAFGTGMQFVTGFERMTQAQYGQYEKLTDKFEQQMRERGLTAEKVTQQIIISQEGNLILKTIETNTLASALATEEMNQRQKTAVYNWPGNVAYIAMGVQAMAQTTINRAGGEPAPPPYTPTFGNTPYIPSGGGGAGGFTPYQYGGEVRETGPAWVHRGEIISPPAKVGTLNATDVMGQPDVHVHVHQYLEGKQIAETTSRIQGNQFWQAQRATYGLPGGLLSM